MAATAAGAAEQEVTAVEVVVETGVVTLPRVEAGADLEVVVADS